MQASSLSLASTVANLKRNGWLYSHVRSLNACKDKEGFYEERHFVDVDDDSALRRFTIARGGMRRRF